MSMIEVAQLEESKLKELDISTWSNWECKKSDFDWEYDQEEWCYILEGKVAVTTESGEKVEIKKGDLVKFPKGLKCKWSISEAIKKVYIFK